MFCYIPIQTLGSVINDIVYVYVQNMVTGKYGSLD